MKSHPPGTSRRGTNCFDWIRSGRQRRRQGWIIWRRLCRIRGKKKTTKKERFLPKRRDAHRIPERGIDLRDSFPLKSFTLLSLSILYKSCTRKRDFFSKQSHLTIKQQESVALLKKLRAWSTSPSRTSYCLPESTSPTPKEQQQDFSISDPPPLTQHRPPRTRLLLA